MAYQDYNDGCTTTSLILLALADITARRGRKGLGNTIDFDDSKRFGWACLFDGNANAFVMLVLVEIQNS